MVTIYGKLVPCRLRAVWIDMLHFLAGCCKRWLNQALSVFVGFSLCCLLGPLFGIVNLIWYAFWLSCQYLSSDWLERLRWRSLTVVRGSFPQRPGRRVFMIFVVCCIVSLFFLCICVVPLPYVTFHTSVTQYSLFVLKVLLNNYQLTN